LEPP